MSVTLLFTDIEGSTRLVQQLGDAYAAALEQHRVAVRAALTAHGGEEIDCRGDEFSIAFADPGHAVAAAEAIQRAPVRVMSGVTDTAAKKQISLPVPSTSASVLVRTSISLRESQPRRMKISGTRAGRRRKNRMSDCFLTVTAENMRSSPIHASTVRGLAGHTFLLSGFLIILLALPLLATANTPAQRWLGKYWKRLQKMTYVIWGFIVLHLLLLDGFRPFGAAQGDGDPVFHQRFYQSVAISIPLVLLRLPPIRRWVAQQREAGRQWTVWLALAPFAALYLIGFVFIINEEIFTGTKVITMHPSAD